MTMLPKVIKLLTNVYFLLIFVFSTSALATEIRLSVGEWPPYLSKDLEHNGAVAQIIREAFAPLGYTVKFEFYPWARAFDEALEGRAQGSGVWLKTAKRENQFYFSDPILEEKHVFFFAANNQLDLSSFETLTSYRYVGLQNFSYGEDLDRIVNRNILDMHRVSNDKQAFGMLLKNRVDIYPQELAVGYYLLRKHFNENKAKQITHFNKPFMRKFSHLMLGKQHRENQILIQDFNKQLAQLKQSGRYDELMASVLKY